MDEVVVDEDGRLRIWFGGKTMSSAAVILSFSSLWDVGEVCMWSGIQGGGPGWEI